MPILSNSSAKPSATTYKPSPKASYFLDYSRKKKNPVLTTTWTILPQPVTVQTDPESTLATNPMNIEQSRLTYITHFPHTPYCSLPRHFLYKQKEHEELLLWHSIFLPSNENITTSRNNSQTHDLWAEHKNTYFFFFNIQRHLLCQ